MFEDQNQFLFSLWSVPTAMSPTHNIINLCLPNSQTLIQPLKYTKQKSVDRSYQITDRHTITHVQILTQCTDSGGFTSKNIFHSILWQPWKQTHHACLLPHWAFSAILITVKKCTNIHNQIIKLSPQKSIYE